MSSSDELRFPDIDLNGEYEIAELRSQFRRSQRKTDGTLRDLVAGLRKLQSDSKKQLTRIRNDLDKKVDTIAAAVRELELECARMQGRFEQLLTAKGTIQVHSHGGAASSTGRDTAVSGDLAGGNVKKNE